MNNIKVSVRFGDYNVPIKMINILNVHQLGDIFAIEVNVEDINTIGYAKLGDDNLYYDAMPNEHWYPEYDEIIKTAIDSNNEFLR